MTHTRQHPHQVLANSHSRVLTEKVSRIDAYLLGYLKEPTADRLEYVHLLLQDWLDSAPKYSLHKAHITYETTPTDTAYRPLWPKEHYDEEREQDKATIQQLRDQYSEAARKLNEMAIELRQRRRQRRKKAAVKEEAHDDYLDEYDQDTFGLMGLPEVVEDDEQTIQDEGISSQAVSKVRREARAEAKAQREAEAAARKAAREARKASKRMIEYLPVHELDYNGLKLPYVVHEGQRWFLAEKTLAAFGVGMHWLKPDRAPVGPENRRRDLNVVGIKRPTLITVEGLGIVGRRANFSSEGLSDLLLAQPLVTTKPNSLAA